MHIASQRLQNQYIEYSHYQNPLEVLSSLAAIQGQDYSGAKWSLGLRVGNTTDAQIEALIVDKKIVRTWLMRRTLFLVAASDIRWLLEIVAARVIAQCQRRYGELELDESILAASNEILFDALRDGQELRRRELYAILEENGISTEGQRGFYITQRASLDALIVHSTLAGNDPYFVRFEDAIPETEAMPRERALAELARCYFRSHGSASLQDFAWWTGLLMGDVRAAFESIQSELVEETINGETYWRLATRPCEESPDSPSVYMLPGFDEYILGYQNRNLVLEPQHATKICPGKNGVFYPTIVIDGQVCGVWKRTFKKSLVVIEIMPFKTFSQREKEAIAAESERFGAYVEKSVTLNFGS